MKRNKFKPGKRITVFFVFFASLFFFLGLWQIERGQAKKTIIEEFNNNLTKKPAYLEIDSKKWDRVFVEGKWDSSKQILIDNVIHRGISGFKVLTPLKIKNSEKTILVDRGWIKRERSRQTIPDIKVREDTVMVS